MVILEAHFEHHDIPVLGRSPIKYWQLPDMIIAVDWDMEQKIKEITIFMLYLGLFYMLRVFSSKFEKKQIKITPDAPKIKVNLLK